MSHRCIKYEIHGPDAAAFLSRVMVKNIAKLKIGQVAPIAAGATTRESCSTTVPYRDFDENQISSHSRRAEPGLVSSETHAVLT